MFSLKTSLFSTPFAKSCKVLLITFALVNANQVIAQDQISFDIPKVSDARVFAEFKDKMPAVVNYYTRKTEQEVISFYQQAYGEIINQERKRGRLTLNYSVEGKSIRVVISQQNNMRQVDVIVNEKTQKLLKLSR